MAVDPNISIMLDIYGEMLTEKERDALDYYYNEDLSLKEIADNEAFTRRQRREQGDASDERETISRQGVRDTIKRAEGKLLDWESKLHLAEKIQRREELVDRIISKAKRISEYNMKHGCLFEISDCVNSIISTASELRD